MYNINDVDDWIYFCDTVRKLFARRAGIHQRYLQVTSLLFPVLTNHNCRGRNQSSFQSTFTCTISIRIGTRPVEFPSHEAHFIGSHIRTGQERYQQRLPRPCSQYTRSSGASTCWPLPGTQIVHGATKLPSSAVPLRVPTRDNPARHNSSIRQRQSQRWVRLMGTDYSIIPLCLRSSLPSLFIFYIYMLLLIYIFLLYLYLRSLSLLPLLVVLLL